MKRTMLHVLLGLVIALAAYLRLDGMTRSFWIDEILTYERAIQSLSHVLHGNSYPLAYVLSHFTLALGDTESLLRLPSYLAGVLAVFIIYQLGKACHSRRTGLVAAFLLACSSIHIYYSQDARFYSLMPLAAVFTLWMATRTIRSTRPLKYWIGLSFGIAFGTLTHPFFLLFSASVAGGTGLAILLRPAQQAGRFRLLLFAAFFFVLGLLPLLIIYLNLQDIPALKLVETSVEEKKRYWLKPDQYKYYVERLLVFQNDVEGQLAFGLTVLGSGLLLVRRRWRALPVIMVPVLMPIPLFIFPVSHWYTEKYFIAMLPGLLVCLSVLFVEVSRYVSMSLYRRRGTTDRRSGVGKWVTSGVLPTAILFLSVESFTLLYFSKNLYDGHWQTSWKGFSENMSENMTGEDVIIHFAPLELNPHATGHFDFEPTVYSSEFYLKRQVPEGRRDSYPTRYMRTASTADVDQCLLDNPTRNIWLVRWATEPMVELSPAQSQMFQRRAGYGFGNTLYVAGAPTRNLVENGGIDPSRQIYGTGKVEIAAYSNLYPDERCARITAGEDTDNQTVSFPVQTPVSEESTSTILSKLPYALSMQLKYDDLPGASLTTRTASLSMTGRAIDGQQFRLGLAEYFGSKDWHFETFLITPEKYPILFASSELQIQLSVSGHLGQLWVDNLQLEQGSVPTPFVDGERLRHDQNLSALGSAGSQAP